MNVKWFKNFSGLRCNILQFQQVSSLVSEKQGLQIGFLRNGDESGTAGPADQRV